MRPKKHEDFEEHAMRVSQVAWEECEERLKELQKSNI